MTEPSCETCKATLYEDGCPSVSCCRDQKPPGKRWQYFQPPSEVDVLKAKLAEAEGSVRNAISEHDLDASFSFAWANDPDYGESGGALLWLCRSAVQLAEVEKARGKGEQVSAALLLDAQAERDELKAKLTAAGKKPAEVTDYAAGVEMVNRRKAEDECEALKAKLLAWEDREAAVCPEDVGFEELVGTLKVKLRYAENVAGGAVLLLERVEKAEAERDEAQAACADHAKDWFLLMAEIAKLDPSWTDEMDEPDAEDGDFQQQYDPWEGLRLIEAACAKYRKALEKCIVVLRNAARASLDGKHLLAAHLDAVVNDGDATLAANPAGAAMLEVVKAAEELEAFISKRQPPPRVATQVSLDYTVEFARLLSALYVKVRDRKGE